MRSLGDPYLPFFLSCHICVPYKVYNNTLTAESQVHRLNHKNLFSRRGSTHRNMNGYISFFYVDNTKYKWLKSLFTTTLEPTNQN